MCDHCGQAIKFGQLPLTESEKARFNWTGHPNGSPNIIEAQCVKAIAEYYGVTDWYAHWDPTLTVDENHDIMARVGVQVHERTMRERTSEFEYDQR